MTAEWSETRLGDVIEVKHGWPFKSELFSDELSGRPIVVNIGNFRYTGGFRFESTTVREYRGDYPREYELSAGDILLVMTCQTPGGEILGVPARVPADGRTYLHNQRLGRVVLRDANRVDVSYLYWLFLSPSFNRELYLSASGTKILHTAPSRLEAVCVRLPTLREQRAIAHILGALDDKIGLNRRMNETLEAMGRALFKSWFVDFDPVRAKAERRDPGLPRPLADLFPSRLDNSESEEKPVGWEVMPAGDAVKPVGGGTPSTQEPKYWGGGEYHWATPKDLSGLTAPILLDTERRITEAGLSQISSGLLPAGTLLMSSRAPVGYLAIAAMPVAINQGFIGMVCDGPVSNYYALNWCHFNMDVIKQRASGTTFSEISKAAFRPISMLVPEKRVMQAFTNAVEPFYDAIKNTLEESRTLATLRDTLLPKLISGELRVRDADRLLEVQP